MADVSPHGVLIDSGVNARHPHVPAGGRLVFAATIDGDGVVRRGEEQVDRLGHGTAAAAAIFDLAPAASLASIKIFDSVPSCPVERIAQAFELALDLAPRVINLSLGSSDPGAPSIFEPLLRRARALGIRVVAPASFRGLASQPGMMEGVDGVVADPSVPRESPVLRSQAGRFFWHASPFPREIPGVPRSRNIAGPSLAAANVTGHLLATVFGQSG